MTVKLNLNPLIKHFERKNSTTASKIKALTDGISKTADSKDILNDMLRTRSKDLCPMCSKSIDESDFKDELSKKEYRISGMCQSCQDNFFEDESESGEFKMGSSKLQIQKFAEALVELADELDSTDPELAREADLLLQDLTKQAMESCKMMGVPGHVHSDKCYAPMGMAMDRFEASPADDSVVVSLHDLDQDPEILEMEEPKPEYDEVSLDDLDDRLHSMKWRVADKPRREALEKAKEHAQKAKMYFDAYKRYRDKTHGIFDEAGEALRLKSFE